MHSRLLRMIRNLPEGLIEELINYEDVAPRLELDPIREPFCLIEYGLHVI